VTQVTNYDTIDT